MTRALTGPARLTLLLALVALVSSSVAVGARGRNTTAPLEASVRALVDTVEVSAGEGYVPVAGEARAGVGDTVRTDEAGRGEITYPDGSLTRLDHATTFRIAALAEAGGGAIEGALDLGRAWNRIRRLLGTTDRFGVTTRGQRPPCAGRPSTSAATSMRARSPSSRGPSRCIRGQGTR